MFKLKRSPFIEGIKEAARVVILAALAYLLTEGVIEFVVEYATQHGLDPQLKLFVVGFTTTILRALEKMAHEEEKKSLSESKVFIPTRLLRF